MAQFISHGPDIPERLLQVHEDGRVVFFCGAGISYPARLPGFGGLVDRLYSALSVSLPYRALGGTFCQRVVSQLHRMLRRLALFGID